MDPDKALQDAREAYETVLADVPVLILARLTAAEKLAESFAALDQWLTMGGFRPAEWKRSL